MLSKISVKKPYTVVVAVVLILILGVVSFTEMTTDLFPSMNLPYAIVMTTDPGASPEEVEEKVTKPVESAMATISNIENINSVSSDNVSMVILEFAETTNMDSVTIEMRESLDQIKTYWDDNIGDPLIMKLNPDMLPVMVAAVDGEGLSASELTDLVNDKVIPDIESLEGVASVTATGEIEESVQVIIRQDKVDEANAKVRAALDDSFADAESEMEDAQSEIKDGKKKLEDGLNEASGKMAEGETQILNGKLDIAKGEVQIATAQSMVQMGETLVSSLEDTLKETKGKASELEQQLKAAEEGLDALDQAKAQIQQQLDFLNSITPGAITPEQAAALQGMLAAIDTSGLTEEQKAAINQAVQMGIQNMPVEVQKGILDALKSGLQGALNQIDQQASQLPVTKEELAQIRAAYDTAKSEVNKLEGSLAEAKKELAENKTKLQEAQEAFPEIKEKTDDAMKQLVEGQSKAAVEMGSAKAMLEMGEKQMDSAKEQFDDTKDTAYDNSDLNNIINTDLIKQILLAQNFSMPAGYVTEDRVDYLVRVGDKVADTEALENLVLLDMGMDGLEPIRLSDVADVIYTDNSDQVYAKINGNPGIMFSIQKQTGYSTGDVSGRLQDRFDKLAAENENLTFTALMDQGIYIDMVINSVLENMLFGGLLAILILLLFLKDIRPTLVIACSIPISILTAIVLMYFSGVTINIISLSGLALGVGMLVDNSIVVIENIYRLRNEGVPVKKAAIDGARQVSGAIMASTLTTISVFAPIIFTQGITRQLFVDMGLTIAYSLLASLFIALTLVPMMSAGLLKNTKEKEHKILDRLQGVCGKGIAWSLRHKAVVLITVVVLLAVSAFGAISRGTAFMPEMESTQVSVDVKMPEGSLLSETAAMTDQVIERLTTIPDVDTVGAMVSSGSMMGMGSSSTDAASLYLILKEDQTMTNAEVADSIKELTQDLDCEVSVNTNTMDMSALGGSGISVRVKGRELDKLQEIAGDVAKIITDTKGTTEVNDGMEETTPEFRIIVNKEKASEYNLTVAQVYQKVQARLADAKAATVLQTAAKDYNVTVTDGEDEELTRQDLEKLTISVTNKDKEKEDVPLSDLCTFTEGEGLSSINRIGNERCITVSASIDKDHNIGLVSSEIQKQLNRYQVPDGYSIEMAGEDETINEAMVQVIKMLLLALVFMYLIMVAQFQSLLSPFIIMFTIPLAFTGGFLGLFLSGSEVSVIAMIGFVMLSGIIVNNGIVLVDYINQLRREGMEKKEAIVEAGRTRLRPILMTAMTTVLGLSTMAAGFGMGADMVQPMAIVTIGGLIYGTLLTLFVVPCIYDLFNRKKDMTEEEIE